MSVNLDIHPPRRWPEPRPALQLLKPITWFPPAFAYLCGVVSSGGIASADWALVALGLFLAGPLVCGMSQVANDWADRHVDAINEPDRPIPSGRVAPGWALAFAVALSVLALAVGARLGPWGFGATLLAVLAAWAYSAPPFRVKRSGWWGPLLVAACYEGLPWITGAAVTAGGAPGFHVIICAGLYAAGAQGIMILNDFKAIAGDRALGIKSLPVVKGPATAARVAATVMILPQTLVVALLVIWGQPFHALAIVALIVAQVALLRRFIAAPVERALWYSAVGVPVYVSGMMVTALAIRTLEIL